MESSRKTHVGSTPNSGNINRKCLNCSRLKKVVTSRCVFVLVLSFAILLSSFFWLPFFHFGDRKDLDLDYQDMAGSTQVFNILRGAASRAWAVERVEKLRVYRNYEMDPRHNLLQCIKYLKAMCREVIHLRHHICETMASKNIIADLNKGDKLNGNNYNTWRHKIWYVLEEQDCLEGINHVMEDPGKYGGTSVIRLRQLPIKFDTYKKLPNHNITQHVRIMSIMIRELKLAGHILSNEQQVHALICSLPDNWEYLKVNLTHNDSIKTFADDARHVELEDERLGAAKYLGQAFVAESSSGKASGFKRKKNCAVYVSSTIMLTESYPMWIAESGATDHVTRDQEAFVEFRRIPTGTKWIYVDNDDRVEVKGIGTCKLHLRSGRTILLHDVLFAPGIRRNLIFVVVLLRGGFVVLDCDSNTYNYYVDRCFSINVSSSSSSKDLNVDTSLVYSDICGPMNVRVRHGASYFITFIDDFTRRYLNVVENQIDRKVKALRTDRGHEYLSKEFRNLCDDKGIIRQLTIPNSSQQNGVAERRNKTLLEMVRFMMAHANLPISYWGDALLTATYILNRVPSKSIPTTPYQLWIGRSPDLSSLRYLGLAAYIHDSSNKFGKLGARGKKCIFIRYSDQSKGYVFIGENQDETITEIKSRDVTFLESDFPSRGEIKKGEPLYELDDRVVLDGSTEVQEETRPPVDPSGRQVFLVFPEDSEEPSSVQEALSCSAKKKWKNEMEEEMESMKSNQVWDLVDLPSSQKAIGNK
ncbi:uncharacterized protein LOC111375338 [Olea europaea var. sylvestris]|uniref:uncharacterized protein LOC111375338 n=1 Tax=Olea europaea var. sylvestris TaxID=158386 RepID=UPI000C1CE6CB|nr:uncharacterized protein LOC111375338 [Olea europaea var. sylvestris]